MRVAKIASAVVLLALTSVSLSAGPQAGRGAPPAPPAAPPAPAQPAAPPTPPPAPPAPSAAAQANLQQMARIDLVLTRFQGEKKISSHPYSFYIAFGPGLSSSTTVRVGTQIPTPYQPGSNGGATYTYQTVGMEIAARLQASQDNRHVLNLSYTDTAAAETPRNEPALASVLPIPVLRSSFASNVLLIRDGQTLPFGSAVDRLTGEVIKSEVTLTIVR